MSYTFPGDEQLTRESAWGFWKLIVETAVELINNVDGNRGFWLKMSANRSLAWYMAKTKSGLKLARGSAAMNAFVGVTGAVMELNNAVSMKPSTTRNGRSLCSNAVQLSRREWAQQSQGQQMSDCCFVLGNFLKWDSISLAGLILHDYVNHPMAEVRKYKELCCLGDNNLAACCARRAWVLAAQRMWLV